MCHSRHHQHRAARDPVDDALSRDPGLRASDAERESTVDLLREQSSAGRLDLEELEQRVGAAYAARTRGDLVALVSDLPATPRAPRPARTQHGDDWRTFLLVSVVLVAIWALSGAGYLWPAWVMVWWAFALVMRSGPRLLRLR